MSEKNDPNPETQPVRPTTDSAPDATAPVPSAPDSPSEAPAPPAPPKRTFRERLAGSGDRVYGIRGLIAASLAALIVGGVGGAAIHAAVDGDRHEHGRFVRGGPPREMGGDFGDFGGRMGEGERPGPPRDFFREGPGGVPGQAPPTTTPDDEESSPSESPSESSSS